MSSSDNKGKDNPNKIRTGYLVNILFLCAIILGILALCVILIFKLRSANKNLTALNERIDAVEGEKDKLYTEEELSSEVEAARKSSASKERTGMLQQIQTSLESGESTTTMLRRLFPDDLVVKNGENTISIRLRRMSQPAHLLLMILHWMKMAGCSTKDQIHQSKQVRG